MVISHNSPTAPNVFCPEKCIAVHTDRSKFDHPDAILSRDKEIPPRHPQKVLGSPATVEIDAGDATVPLLLKRIWSAGFIFLPDRHRRPKKPVLPISRRHNYQGISVIFRFVSRRVITVFCCSGRFSPGTAQVEGILRFGKTQ